MEAEKLRALAGLGESKTVEMLDGIFRTTLAYNQETMLCHFTMKKGAKIPLHSHEAVQIGYIISGKVKFVKGNGDEHVAEATTSYVFQSQESHGAEVLSDAEVVECFSPMRPEYAD